MSLNVSQLLDGQIEDSLVKPVLEEVAGDSVSRDRYTVYGLIGDTLRGNSTPDDGFTRRIFERLTREGARIESDFDPLAN